MRLCAHGDAKVSPAIGSAIGKDDDVQPAAKIAHNHSNDDVSVRNSSPEVLTKLIQLQ